MVDTHKTSSKRRPVTLSVRRDLLAEAKTLKVNASRAAENGLVAAIREANESAWLSANEGAIADYNKNIHKTGTFFTPEWIKTD